MLPGGQDDVALDASIGAARGLEQDGHRGPRTFPAGPRLDELQLLAKSMKARARAQAFAFHLFVQPACADAAPGTPVLSLAQPQSIDAPLVPAPCHQRADWPTRPLAVCTRPSDRDLAARRSPWLASCAAMFSSSSRPLLARPRLLLPHDRRSLARWSPSSTRRIGAIRTTPATPVFGPYYSCQCHREAGRGAAPSSRLSLMRYAFPVLSG